MPSDVGAVALLGVLALGGALLLRERSSRSWPRSLAVLLPVAAVLAALVLRTDAATYLWRGIGSDERWLPVALAAVAVGALALCRTLGASWVAASWVAGGLLLVGLTTLPSGEDGPHLAADPVGQLRSCLLAEHRVPSFGFGGASVGGASVGGGSVGGGRTQAPTVLALAVPQVGAPPTVTPSRLPALDVHKLTTEQLPNVALFVPLGIGIAAVARRRTGWWITLAAVLSVGVESYQAVFTSRTCSTVDVATNALGVLLGWAAYLVATRLTTGLTTGLTTWPTTGPATRPPGDR